MSPEIEDVKRVLAICFRDGSRQTADDLERYYPSTWDGWTQKPLMMQSKR